jgi:hypothetical protein
MTNIKFGRLAKLRWAAVGVASTVLITACGGGNSSDDLTTPTPTPTPQAAAAVYAGPIAGFGSVIVNGMRFSSVGAELVDDDSQAIELKNLAIGMTVRVSGDADDSTQLGTARKLEVVRGTRGAVTVVDLSASTLTVLGQVVHTDTATAFQGLANLAALTVGQVVEVYGATQADGSLLATLVETKVALGGVRLVGVLQRLNAPAATFQVGNLTVKYDTALVTGVLRDGQQVRVRAASEPVNGVLTATAVRSAAVGVIDGSTVSAGTRMKVKGIALAAPVNGQLQISGTTVDLSQAQIKSSGGATSIVAGQVVEVKGLWNGTLLQATDIELEGYRESQVGGRHELYGAISSLSGSLAVVNGVTVDLARGRFEHGSLAQVAVGSYVEIKGNLLGNVLQANKVELKSAATGNGVSYEQFGPVSGFVSVADFRLNGLQVDASRARFEHIGAAGLANGVYVEVKGVQDNRGVFMASKLELKSQTDD